MEESRSYTNSHYDHIHPDNQSVYSMAQEKITLFVNTGDPSKKLMVCVRIDDTIGKVCQIIANIYYKTFMVTEQTAESNWDYRGDFYYERVQTDDCVKVDHLTFNGFLLPAQHKAGDLLTNRSTITAQVAIYKAPKRKVGRPKKTSPGVILGGGAYSLGNSASKKSSAKKKKVPSFIENDSSELSSDSDYEAKSSIKKKVKTENSWKAAPAPKKKLMEYGSESDSSFEARPLQKKPTPKKVIMSSEEDDEGDEVIVPPKKTIKTPPKKKVVMDYGSSDEEEDEIVPKPSSLKVNGVNKLTQPKITPKRVETSSEEEELPPKKKQPMAPNPNYNNNNNKKPAAAAVVPKKEKKEIIPEPKKVKKEESDEGEALWKMETESDKETKKKFPVGKPAAAAAKETINTKAANNKKENSLQSKEDKEAKEAFEELYGKNRKLSDSNPTQLVATLENIPTVPKINTFNNNNDKKAMDGFSTPKKTLDVDVIIVDKNQKQQIPKDSLVKPGQKVLENSNQKTVERKASNASDSSGSSLMVTSKTAELRESLSKVLIRQSPKPKPVVKKDMSSGDSSDLELENTKPKTRNLNLFA